MKKSLKLILIIGAVALLVCAAVVVAIFATGESEQSAEQADIRIVAANLSFSDSVYIKYAVDYANVDSAEIQMLIWNEPMSEYNAYVKGTEDAVLSNGYEDSETKYWVFDYKELAAKQMTDVVYARAYAKIGNTEYYSQPVKYSILQYAYNMMGKTSTATDNAKLIDLLENMLNYGALAQNYTQYKTNSLATDSFVQIKLAGGVLPDGFDRGLYKVGTAVKLTAPATLENYSFVGWRNLAGEIVSSDSEFTVTVGNTNEYYAAVYQGVTSDKLQYVTNEDGVTYSVVGIGGCTDTNIVVPSVVNGKLVTEIADGAFAGCTTLKSITLSENIESIGANAFNGCTSLTSIYYDGSQDEWNAIKKDENWNASVEGLNIFWEKDWGMGGVPLN